jgi:hypothetical protein
VSLWERIHGLPLELVCGVAHRSGETCAREPHDAGASMHRAESGLTWGERDPRAEAAWLSRVREGLVNLGRDETGRVAL